MANHAYIDSSINYSYSKPQKQQPLVKHMYLYSVQYKLNYNASHVILAELEITI